MCRFKIADTPAVASIIIMGAEFEGRITISTLLVDPYPVVREGCRHAFLNSSDVVVAGEAAELEGACATFARRRADVIIYEFPSPGSGGLEAIGRLSRLDPSSRVLVYSNCRDENLIVAAIKAGAAGFLSKERETSELVAAVRAVARGQHHIDSSRGLGLIRASLGTTPAGPLGLLSPREHQLFCRFADGEDTSAIAAALSISGKTVAVHRTAIMRKLGIKNAAQLVRLALKCGVIRAD
jgi:two-component system invasion response regulator UvrY